MSVSFELDNDPLINPMGGRLFGWARRIWGVSRRSGGMSLRIFAITNVLPATGFYLLMASDLVGQPFGPRPAAESFAPTGMLVNSPIANTKVMLGPLLIVLLAALALVVLPQLVGYAAATYAATRAVADLPSTIGQALRYGLRRAAGLVAWTVLGSLMVALIGGSFAFCFSAILTIMGLPPQEATKVAMVIALGMGAFTAIFAAFTGLSFLFERGFALRRSFELVADQWGWVGLRLLPVAGALLGGQLLTQFVVDLPTSVIDGNSVLATGLAAILGTVVALPFSTVAFSTLLVSYAERRRIDQTTLTSVNLINELDGRYGMGRLPGVPSGPSRP